jgi:hypothetical protein
MTTNLLCYQLLRIGVLRQARGACFAKDGSNSCSYGHYLANLFRCHRNEGLQQ